MTNYKDTIKSVLLQVSTELVEELGKLPPQGDVGRSKAHDRVQALIAARTSIEAILFDWWDDA